MHLGCKLILCGVTYDFAFSTRNLSSGLNLLFTVLVILQYYLLVWRLMSREYLNSRVNKVYYLSRIKRVKLLG